MKGYLITALWGILVWLFATLFFVFFGERVLFSPRTENFTTSLFLLVGGTGVLLWCVTYIYSFFDRSMNAPLRFGIIGTIIGLSLDTFSLSNHHLIFSKLDDTQVIAFTVWMSFAYALYLLIPAMINQHIMKHRKISTN